MDLDKKLGLFLGLAIGDALGAPLEFQKSREPNQYLTKYIKGGPHNVSIGEWTDDTSMALALATSLIEKKCFDGSLAHQCASKRVLLCRLCKKTECNKLPDELCTVNVHERSVVN